MLHKRTSIKESSSSRGYPSWVEVKSSNQRNAMCWHGLGSNFYIPRLKSIINIRNPNFFERIVIYGGNNSVSFPTKPFLLQGSMNQCFSFMRVHADTTIANWSPSLVTPPPSKSLFCSTLPSLVHSFSAKSQIGGWGVFCGLYKRTKVVRTLLYESVGRG